MAALTGAGTCVIVTSVSFLPNIPQLIVTELISSAIRMLLTSPLAIRLLMFRPLSPWLCTSDKTSDLRTSRSELLLASLDGAPDSCHFIRWMPMPMSCTEQRCLRCFFQIICLYACRTDNVFDHCCKFAAT